MLREAVELGITHIDTSDSYGPHVTNEIIREALHPYPDDAAHRHQGRRPPRRAGRLAARPATRRAAPSRCTTTSSRLGLDALDVVNLRLGGVDGPGARLARRAVRGAGRTAAAGPDPAPRPEHGRRRSRSPRRRRSRRSCACRTSTTSPPRRTTTLIDALAAQGIAYVPYFPLGGFTPLQSEALARSPTRLDATPMAVALAWLLQRSPNILLIPGTSSVAHLRENVAGAA